ncbi:unnamed protein product [Symbiodinium natans]|uniref:Uncharacterized protein n=1 Tax=Symbiodinium natans TaxID=878477 RepID=A0A812J0H3_9DINO|nr:unnamed protein product [Symbiodinium natans]
MGARERQATTASTYIQAALSALRGQTGGGKGVAIVEEGEEHLVAALQCPGRVTGEEEEEEGDEYANNSAGGTTPLQPPPPAPTREPGPGEEGYGSSSSRDRVGVAQPDRHSRLVEPITRSTEEGHSKQGGGQPGLGGPHDGGKNAGRNDHPAPGEAGEEVAGCCKEDRPLGASKPGRG